MIEKKKTLIPTWEVAEKTSLSAWYIRKLARTKAIPALRVRGKWWFEWERVRRALDRPGWTPGR